MTRPQSSALTVLGWFATITLCAGVGAWVIAFFVFFAQLDSHQDAVVMQGAFDWMNLGGVLAGFGVLALVGYLVAAAIGDFMAALTPAPAKEAGPVGTWLSRRLVGDGVDADPHPDGGDRD